MHIAMIITPLFIGYTEIILIVVLALIFFGGKKIPELMRGMGRGVKEFKDAVNKDYTAEEQPGSDSTPDGSETVESAPAAATEATAETAETETPAPAKRRGRPRKNPAPEAAAENAPAPARKRGRPRKNAEVRTEEPAPAAQPKRRGRPKKQA